MMFILLVNNNVWSRILQTDSFGNLSFKIFLKCSNTRELEAVWVPLVLLVVDGEVLGHSIASVLIDNGSLMLG